jgi:polysaccharide biosynthesis transport protein
MPIPRSKKGPFTENDIMIYVSIALKHLRLMVLLMCLALMLGLVYYTYAQPVYYSISLVQYEVLQRQVDTQAAYKDSTDRVVLTQLASPYVKERTARRFGIKKTAREIDKTILRKLVVRLDSQRNIVIEVAAYSFPLTKDWAEVMVQEYLLYREERRLERAQLMIQTYSKEMAEMKEKNNELFNSKYNIRGTNELTKIMIELDNLREIPKELLIVKKKLGMMDRTRGILEMQELDTLAKLSLLAALDRDMEPRLNAQVGDAIQQANAEGSKQPIIVVPPMVEQQTGANAWDELDKERRRLQQKDDELARTFMPGHKSRAEVRKQLSNVGHALELELEVATNRFALTYANLTSKKRELEERLPEFEDVMKRHEKAMMEFRGFDDGQLAWQHMHADMERRLNVLDFADDKERATLKYLGYGEPLRDYPISPHRLKLVIYSFVLGIILAIGVPYLIEYLDSRVSDIEDAEESLRIRGLGVVAKITAPGTEGMLLLGDQKPDYHLQENFRVIRTNLVVNSEDASLPQVIIVTSAMPQEGKTVVSSNLAASFAMKGETTLLIDADLRRGRLHRVFGAHSKPGLSDVLGEKKPYTDAFRPTGHENLTLMTCGKHLNSASELLDNVAFGKLIEELRGKYQRIIIDTPPVLGLAETAIIQRFADGILFVIWSDFTPMRNVKAAIQSLQGNGAKFAGFVLNRLDFNELGNRYKYFYYAPNYYTNYKAIEAPAVAKG